MTNPQLASVLKIVFIELLRDT